MKKDVVEPTQVAEAKTNSSKAYDRGIPSMIGFTVVLFIVSLLISGAGGLLSICGIFGMVSAQQDVLTSCHGIFKSSVNSVGFDQRVVKKCQTLDVQRGSAMAFSTGNTAGMDYNLGPIGTKPTQVSRSACERLLIVVRGAYAKPGLYMKRRLGVSERGGGGGGGGVGGGGI